MSDELLTAADARDFGLRTHWETCYLVHDLCLIAKLAARVRELQARSAHVDEQATKIAVVKDELAQRVRELEAELARIRNADDTSSGRQRDALRRDNDALRRDAEQTKAAHEFVTKFVRWAQQYGHAAVVEKANELGQQYNAAIDQARKP